MEKPNIHKTAKVARRQIGTVTAGMIVARQLPKNRKMTRTTSAAASARVIQTPLIALPMNSESSEPTEIVMPRGSAGLICSASALALSATAKVFAPDWRTMPKPKADSPFNRNAAYGFSGPVSTRATSDRRVSDPSAPRATTNCRNSASLPKGRLTRSVTFWSVDSKRPAGNSTFWLRKAFSTSSGVNPSAASRSG